MTTERPTLTAYESPEPLILSNSGREGLRYLVASIAALAVDAGILALAVGVFALPSWVGGALAYGCGLVFIYTLSIRWVFTARTVGNPQNEFALFAALGLVGLLLNSLVLYVATTVGLVLPVAKALSAGIGFVANFVSRKVLLFSKTSR